MLASCLSLLLPSRSNPASEVSPLLKCEKEKLSGDDSWSDRVVRRKPTTTARLEALRELLEDHKLDAYVVPTADAHASEYVGECDKRRAWLSNFTGSAGVAVVTKTEAFLFTDSRYYVQAAKELDSNWSLQKVGLSGVPSWDEFITKLPEGSRVGTDARLTSAATAKSLLSNLSSRSISLVFPDTNLVDEIWTDQPPRSAAAIVVHPLKFAGQAASEKITNLRTFLSSSSPSTPSSYLLNSLVNVAWILNLRGSDILFSPLFYGYLLVSQDELVLYVQEEAVGAEVKAAVERLGGRVSKYEDVWKEVKGRKIFSNQAISWALVQAIGEDNFTGLAKSPIDIAQALKNPVELEGFRRAYLRDAVAWVRWAAWLEETVKSGRQVSEWDAAEKFTSYRESGENFAGLAYDNISATGEHAALPHYSTEKENSTIIDRTSPYLNDSGAQYLDGTIDTTRTVHFGKPTKEHKRAFTRVLQGHIAIDSLIFPEGTTGLQVDILGRRPLWQDGMNYLHGTGHGVGEYLSVHEGPQGFGASLVFQAYPLVPGHVLSNEPGYYEEGAFGIRTESVLGVKEVSTRRGFGDKKWYGFERFTTVPIQSSLVDWKLLSTEEKVWLQKHNKLCRSNLLPFLAGDKRAAKYLAGQ